MPELPEVETVRKTLLKKILNKKITKVEVFYPNIIVEPTLEKFKKELINQTIIDIKRKGKWLIFELNDYYLLSHLRMEGKYNLKKITDGYDKHEHVSFIFEDETCLRYKDTRKFGRMYLYKKDEAYNNKPLNELGLEPWDKELNTNYLKEKYKNKKMPIKTVILDQSIVVGIGNIYADEILFLSNINPLKNVYLLSDSELKSIINNTKKVMEKSIKNGGTTIKSYESSEGVHGMNQNYLFVHSRENCKCKKCESMIIKIKVGGRGTYYCPNCQKL